MGKMISRYLAAVGVLAAFAVSAGTGPAAAMSANTALVRALSETEIVLVAQKKKQRKAKRSQPKISPEHQQQIRQHVPPEFHQYIPGLSGGGAGGAAGAGGIPGAR